MHAAIYDDGPKLHTSGAIIADPVAAPSLRSQANASLEQLRQSPDGWLFCLQAFSAAAEEHVKFWCLQTLVDMAVRDRRYAGLPQEQKATLRNALVSWLQSKGPEHTDEPASVKNKFSQLLVAIVRVEYPHSWPDVFQVLLSTLQQGPVSIDLFLRTLNALNEDVVVNEESNGYDSEVAARVKDGMREQCLVQIADAWMSILRLHESAPALSAACLQTVALYVPWIPISLVANPLWLGLLQPFLSNAQLHEGSCAGLREIGVKRMEPQAKMAHLQNLQIVARLNEGVGGSNGGVPITTSSPP